MASRSHRAPYRKPVARRRFVASLDMVDGVDWLIFDRFTVVGTVILARCRRESDAQRIAGALQRLHEMGEQV